MAIEKRKRLSRVANARAHARVSAAATAALRNAQSSDFTPRAPGALATPVENVSKSAQRRRRRRAREELGARGMKDLSDVVEDVEDEIPQAQDSHTTIPVRNTPTGAKAARLALQRERTRQPQIMAQLSRTENPFAALRTHARNTLGLSDA